MSMTDKEANKRLEKVQQCITLTLQAIDLNFAKCNQIVSTTMIPTIDKYNEATREVWNNSKVWNCLFKPLDYTDDVEHESNRLPFSPLASTFCHDMKKNNRSALQLIQDYHKIAFALREATNVINDSF